MKKKQNRLLHLVVAAIAIINLGFLFLFQYGLSNATPAVQAAVRASEERAAYDVSSGFNTRSGPESGAVIIAAENSEEDGTDESADAVEPAEPEEEAAPDFPSEEEEEALTEESSADSVSEEFTGKPSITLESKLPEVALGNLPKIAAIFTDLDYLSADDGFGNDISDQITATYEETAEGSMEYNVVFSVTTRSGETVTKEATVTAKNDDHPVLELTKEKITLELYDEFYYMDYIKMARDVDGTSLVDYVYVSGYVDTNYYDTYQLTYSITSYITGETVQKTLTVTVE